MRRGVTLLEAVLALAMLGAVAVAVLEARASSIRAAERLREAQRDAREVESLFRMLTERALPAPESGGEPIDGGPAPQPVWRGVHLGEAYEITREPIAVRNPAAEALADSGVAVSREVGVFEYTIRYGGAEERFLWHR